MDDAGRPTAASRNLWFVNLLIELLMTALLLFLPAARGTVTSTSEAIAIAIAGAIAVLLAIRWVLIPNEGSARWMVWTPIALFVLLAAAQLVPLPPAVIKSLSPQTYALKTELLSDLPDALSRMTISFYALGARHDLRLVFLTVVVFATIISLYRDERRIRRLLCPIVVIAAGAAVLALAQDATRTRAIYWLYDTGKPANSGPFFNHSHFGQFMNLSIAAAIALLLIHWRRWRIVAPVGLFIIIAWAAIALSRTRGGISSAGVAMTFTALAIALSRRSRAMGALTVALALGTVVIVWVVAFDPQRIMLSRDVWDMSRHYPLTGAGLGTFEWTYPMFDHIGDVAVAAYAENEYLQVLAEMGWPGLTIVLAFVAIVWWHYVRALRSGDPFKSSLAIGMGYGLLAAMLHSITDYGQHIPAVAALAAIACGLIINAGTRAASTAPARFWRIPAAAVLLIAAAWVIVGAVRASAGDEHWRAARRLAARLEDAGWHGSPEEIDHLRREIDAAVAAEGDDVHLLYWRAVYGWRVARRQFGSGSAELIAASRAIIDDLNTARRFCPTFGSLYTVLGQIEYGQLNDPAGAAHIELATRLQPNDSTAWFTAGRVHARRGDFDAANKFFRRAIDLDFDALGDVADLYLDELDQPNEAIKLAEGDRNRLRFLGNRMKERPKYFELGLRVYDRGTAQLVADAKAQQTPQLIMLAGYALLTNGNPAEAEPLFANGMRLHPGNPELRFGYAHSLVMLNRLDQASGQLDLLEEARFDPVEVTKLRQQIDVARAKSAATRPRA